MALDFGQLTNDIQAAFDSTSWTTCAEKLASAIDDYITGGLITTTVNGTVTAPFPMPPYQAVGTGTYDKNSDPKKGSMSTPGLSTLKSILTTKFNDSTVTWSLVGEIIGSAIDDYVSLITITTKDENILEGTGVGAPGCINTAGTYGALVSSLTNVFTNQAIAQDWTTAVQSIASAIQSYIQGAIVTTTDSGTTPATSWTGSGSGSIT